MPNGSAILTVTGHTGKPEATLTAFGRQIPAIIGREGLVAEGASPAEGDWSTPLGTFGFRTVYYRPGRMARPRTGLPVVPLRPDMGWCDDPSHPLYNRPVALPFAASHEKMWREDRLYDLVVVLDFNLARPAKGGGSAIFFHLTKWEESPPPTAGCVAIPPAEMVPLLSRLRIGDAINIRRAG